jgi:hypothetical protein
VSGDVSGGRWRARAHRRWLRVLSGPVQERAAEAEAELLRLARRGRHPAPELLEQQRAALRAAATPLPAVSRVLCSPLTSLQDELLAAWVGLNVRSVVAKAQAAETELLVRRAARGGQGRGTPDRHLPALLVE